MRTIPVATRSVWSAAVIFVVMLLLSVVAPGATAAPATTVSVSPSDADLSPGETTDVFVIVEHVEGGVGAYTATVSVDDPSVASVQDVVIHGDADEHTRDVDIAADNSSVTISAALMDTDNTGAVTVATVTVKAVDAGSTPLSLSVPALGDESGSPYTVAGTNGATIDVASESSDGSDSSAGDGSGPADDPDDVDDPQPQGDLSAAQDRLDNSVAPGRTISIETTVSATDLNAPALALTLPPGWSVDDHTAEGPATYKRSAHEWVWLTGGEYTVTYTVGVPDGAPAGDYPVTAEWSAIDPATDDRLVETVETTVTVEEATQPATSDPASGPGGAAASGAAAGAAEDGDGPQSDSTSVRAPPVVGPNPPPDDPDRDGVFEDIDGNGVLDHRDAETLFAHMDDPTVTDQVSLYDFNGNGRIDFDDVVTLYQET